MERLILELSVPRVGLDFDRHPTDRILCRLSPFGNVRLCVLMIVVHILPTFC